MFFFKKSLLVSFHFISADIIVLLEVQLYMTDRAASINSGSNTNAVMSCKLLDLLFSEKKIKIEAFYSKKTPLLFSMQKSNQEY